jgi:hypothetical protein
MSEGKEETRGEREKARRSPAFAATKRQNDYLAE